MQNIFYKIQRISQKALFSFLRDTVIWLAHTFRIRYFVVYFDPVLGCNLRCLSCYFSNDERRKQLKGQFPKEELKQIADAIFKETLRLQIGCGAEPTLYKHNAEVIRLGKEYGVKYITFTTNANLLTENEIINLLSAGLDEITISIHGVKEETYEFLMVNGSFNKLLNVLKILSKQKVSFPNFKIRINYTISHLNLDELSDFFTVFDEISIDILQLRALNDIGGKIKYVETTENFFIKLKTITNKLQNECKKRNIYYIAPNDFEDKTNKHAKTIENNAAYCYISPNGFWESDFDWKNENYRKYSKRTKYGLTLFRNIFKK